MAGGVGRASAVVFGGAVRLAGVSDLERFDFFCKRKKKKIKNERQKRMKNKTEKIDTYIHTYIHIGISIYTVPGLFLICNFRNYITLIKSVGESVSQ